MKRLFTLIAVLFLAMVAAFGQNNKLSYQAVVRNSANELVANENITVVISILNGTTADAPVAYSEQHTVTTNQNGLMSLLIGDGTNQTGSFADVQWDNASVKSEITLPDGNVTSIVPMTAVPYALYAANANAGITAKDLENFIDTVTLPTALSVYGHVQTMNNDIKTGLKAWVTQVVKNNPTYAMDVLTHYIKNLTPAQVSEIFGAYDDMTSAQAKEDLLNGLAQIIKDNPAIAYDVIDHYIDNVTLAQALDVYSHVQTMNDTVKRGLKMWVAQVAKNNPEYVMDIAKHYVTYANQSVVDELVAADDDNALGYAFDKLAPNSIVPQMIHDSLANIQFPEQVQADWNETDNTSKAFIQNKPTIGNGEVRFYQDHTNAPQAVVPADNPDNPNTPDNPNNDPILSDFPNAEFLGAFTLNDEYGATIVLPSSDPTPVEVRLMQGDSVLGTILTLDTADKDIEIPGLSLTAKDLENFIDTVTLPTALSVYGHVQGMNSQIKEGLKLFVAQTVKNNPTYAMDVLTHYIQNLTVDQVGQVVGAYNQMNSTSKDSVLNVVAQIIKDNPDIAYDVLNYYIDNVDVQRAMSVLPHINGMDSQVKQGLKVWIAQKVINNPDIILQVLKAYLNTPNATTKEEVVTQYAIAHRDVAKNIMVDYLQNGTADDVNALVAALAGNTAGGKTQFQNLLNAYIDSRIAAATETSQKFTATASQTSFTLTNAPKRNYLVRMYINGVMVGDSATGVVTVNGTTVTYVPAQNGNYSLTAGDTIIISYFK